MANADNRRTAHIISHTHWDREWYLPYEKHHVRLIELMDTLLDTLENDAEYRSFYLDGQTIIIEDYLQVRPDQRERLEQWHPRGPHSYRTMVRAPGCVPDEQRSERSQSADRASGCRTVTATIVEGRLFPRHLRQHRPSAAAYAAGGHRQRGVRPRRQADGLQQHGLGFRVRIVRSRSSYGKDRTARRCSASCSPTGTATATKCPWTRRKPRTTGTASWRDAGKYASTGQLLFMNGCDHQPIQTDLAGSDPRRAQAVPGHGFRPFEFPGLSGAR